VVERMSPASPMRGEPIVELRRLAVEYGAGERSVRAVDGIDLTIHAGEVVGLAGESGCGKSTVANAVMQILRPPARIAGGSILFRGGDLVTKKREELRKYRWRNVSMVFQSAMNSLNPVMRVGDQFLDMMRAHEHISKKAAVTRAGELLDVVGIDPRRVRAFPHELSGGMRQRVAIARALIHDAPLLLMDEPFGALDALTREQMRLDLEALWLATRKTVIFITHSIDEAVLLADRVIVMSPHPGRIERTMDIALVRPRGLGARRDPEFVRASDAITDIFLARGVLRRASAIGAGGNTPGACR
jgi:peptide/nickel transport system ATP-binding protein